MTLEELLVAPPRLRLLLLVVGGAAIYGVRFFVGSADMARRFAQRPGHDVVFARFAAAVILLIGGGALAVATGASRVEAGLGLPRAQATVAFIVVGRFVTLPSVYWSAQRPHFWRHYPEARVEVWDTRFARLSAASWLAYLIGYEFFFRGVLIFGLAASLDPWSAVGITTMAYVLVHLPTNPNECAVTLPMGFFFGFGALMTGSFVGPLVVHVTVAVLSERWAAIANPMIVVADPAKAP